MENNPSIPKVVLLSGTSRGLGLALAEHYLDSGWKVVGCSRKAVNLPHENYRHFTLDISDESSVVNMVRTVKSEFGRIDALLNNAGQASMNALALTPADTLSRLLQVNVVGAFSLLREVAKVMMRQKQGRIVNFSSIAAPLALEGEAAYAASKAAVESLTKVAARELADYGITVNAIGPSPIRTDLIRGVPEQKLQSLINRQPIKEFATAEDVINTVDFFLREESSRITGQIIYLCGVSQ